MTHVWMGGRLFLPIRKILMKKNITAFLTLAGLLALSTLLFAADNLSESVTTQPEMQNMENTVPASTPQAKDTAPGPTNKLSRGIVNIVTSPVEIAKQVDLSWKESAKQSKNVSGGIFSGLFKGLAYTVGRMGSGIWDVVSFPFKTPGNYEPLMKPDYVLDKESNSQK